MTEFRELESAQETIAAIATPPGVGGVGIIRISGSNASVVAETITGQVPQPRHASYREFRGSKGELIDQGIVLFFPAPYSFTGEDVLELQGHGGPVVMDLLLQAVLANGVRLAHPGEFSQRAFVNGKLDLTQAEAIADLIESSTAHAARLAVHSLQGEFSHRVHRLTDQVTQLRIFIEASIDFPEEDIDFLSDSKVTSYFKKIRSLFNDVLKNAELGQLLRDGMSLVIAGRPNAGKSSLLNVLSGQETAIVTEIPGTTRDLLHQRIQIDGMPLHLVDTAGLRESDDLVEQEGIRRAKEEIERADLILWIFDDQTTDDELPQELAHLSAQIPITCIRNKIDLTQRDEEIRIVDSGVEIALSAKTGLGIDLLRNHLKERMGYQSEQQGAFIARRRHLDALEKARQYFLTGQSVLENRGAAELLAEDLRQCQNALSEITGEVTSDDLLGRIFADFCIGK